jgi:hypothetical protein
LVFGEDNAAANARIAFRLIEAAMGAEQALYR